MTEHAQGQPLLTAQPICELRAGAAPHVILLQPLVFSIAIEHRGHLRDTAPVVSRKTPMASRTVGGGRSLLGVALDVGEAERLLHQPLVPRLLLLPRVLVATAPLAEHLQPLLRLHADRARVESLHAQRAECLRSTATDSSEAPGHRGEADAGCAR